MTRRETREQAFILIFESLFRDDSIDDIIALANENEEFTINDDVIAMFRGTVEKTEEIDGHIEKYSEKRQLDRIPKVNMAIIRLAIYEILYGGTPVGVAINEAVLIAKKYTYENDVAFINGVLGSFARSAESK